MAGTIFIDEAGGSLALTSKDLSGTVFGNGPNIPPTFTNAALQSIHDDIAANQAEAITTNGKISVVALDTNFGLSICILVDNETTNGFNTLTSSVASDRGRQHDEQRHLSMTTEATSRRLALVRSISMASTVGTIRTRVTASHGRS